MPAHIAISLKIGFSNPQKRSIEHPFLETYDYLYKSMIFSK
ncbi:hypothetical protein [Okeania sp. SIO3B5]|nr:hypothetical protein [Okeania sp. SIO3B5]